MTPDEVDAIAEVLKSTPLDDSLRIAADDVELKTPEQVIPPPVRRSNSKGFSVRSPPELPPTFNSNSGFFASGNTTPSKGKQLGKHPLTPSKRLASPARSTSASRRFDAPASRVLSPVRQQPSRTHSSAATGSHASPAQKKRTNSQTFAGNRQAVRTLSPRAMARCDSAVRRTIRTDSASRGKKLSRCASKGTSERQTFTSSFDRPTRKSSVVRQGSLFSHDKPKGSLLKKDLKLPQGEVMETIKNSTRALSRSATDSKLASPTFSRKASRRECSTRPAPHADIFG